VPKYKVNELAMDQSVSVSVSVSVIMTRAWQRCAYFMSSSSEPIYAVGRRRYADVSRSLMLIKA
jgi:hypothetical protein